MVRWWSYTVAERKMFSTLGLAATMALNLAIAAGSELTGAGAGGVGKWGSSTTCTVTLTGLRTGVIPGSGAGSSRTTCAVHELLTAKFGTTGTGAGGDGVPLAIFPIMWVVVGSGGKTIGAS